MMLRQLEYLVALAREKHFGRAAAACNVSQPTLSAAIRQLEEELGAPIVERGHKFHGFTAQGRAALDHAHRILAEASALKRDLEEMDRGLSGRLRIGAIPTALPIIAHLTAPFYQRFPNVSVTILSLNSQQIQQGIDDFELEVGLTYLDNEPLTNVRTKPIFVEHYMFLTPATGPYARFAQARDGDQFDFQSVFACLVRLVVVDRPNSAFAVFRRAARREGDRIGRAQGAADDRPDHG